MIVQRKPNLPDCRVAKRVNVKIKSLAAFASKVELPGSGVNCREELSGALRDFAATSAEEVIGADVEHAVL